MLYLQHFLFELGLRGSVGKALNRFLVLELVALQMGNMEKHLFGIGRDLTTKSLEDSFGRVGVIDEARYCLLRSELNVLDLSNFTKK